MSTAEAAMAKFEDLAKVSKQINQRSDEANQILKELEQKLVAMNLGVEAWITKYPLTSIESTVEMEDKRDYELYDERHRTDEVLGFGYFGDRQMLLVKESFYSESPHQLTQYGNWRLDRETEAKPLLQASRQLRIEALGNIEHLIDAVLVEAKKVIEAIDKGRKTVDNL